MTAKEVEAILGRPPDDSSWGPLDSRVHEWERHAAWGCYHVYVDVYYDEEEKVVGTNVEAVWLSPWELVPDLVKHPL
jgi:hypothetical protein